MAILIALFLTFSMTASTMLIPNASAHTPPWKYPTWAYISVEPNPVGIGQPVSVNFWIDKVPPTAANIFGDRFYGYTVTVTHPDGTKETLGPFTSDDAGGGHCYYTPTALGNYTFVFTFPGQKLAGANPNPIYGTINPQDVNDTYLPSTSSAATLTVQQSPITWLPTAPLPTNYWTRPIESQNINWYTISGDWLGASTYNVTTNFNPYTLGPTTGHIMWTKPYSAGGLIGGTYGGGTTNSNYMSTNQYQTKISPIIMDGILYYELYPGATSSPEGWVAVNLQTGQTLWTKSTTDVLKCGQIMDFTTPNQRGGIPYLWANPMATTNGVVYVASNSGGQILVTSTLEMFDAMTGNWILNIVGVPGMTQTFDSIGSMIGYYINSTTTAGIYGPETLNMWNSTLAIQNYGWNTHQDYNVWTWQPPQGASIPFADGIQWTVPLVTTMKVSNGTVEDINWEYQVDTGLLGANPNDASTPSSYPLAITKVADVILVDDSASGIRMQQPGYWISEGYSPSTGALIWGPTNNTIPAWTRMATSSAGDGIYTIYVSNTYSFYAYSLATGKLLWGPTSIAVTNNPWNYYVDTSMIAYGNLYSVDFGGNVFCINATTGAIEWHLSLGSSGLQTPYGVWPITNFQCIADGMIYFNGGHLYSPPIYTGATLDCVNATSGALIWSMPDFAITNAAKGAISDGYLVVPNGYDNQLYCYGIGPSKTTVTAPDVGVTTATPITITGTVTDISAGSQQNAVAMNFPNGLPCVSDASMTQWMEYVYEQQPMPTNVTGVPVTVSVTDSNGNHYDIGTTTTTPSGFYSLTWTPTIPGNFTVTATFAGTQSYYGSYAQTAFYASAPPATPAPTATPVTGLATASEVTYGIIAAIVVIIIIGVILAMLMLRKRP